MPETVSTYLFHTPGPWKLDYYPARNGDRCARVRSEDGSTHIADCAFVVESWEKANAALIAAAPELLNAIQDLAHRERLRLNAEVRDRRHPNNDPNCDCSEHRDLKRAEAAIQKATGQAVRS